MLKHFFSPNVDHGVGFLASANLAGNGIVAFLAGAEPALKVLLVLAQCGVAAVTIFYVYRKAIAVKVPQKRTRKPKAADSAPPVSP